jgi:hypothetical protein
MQTCPCCGYNTLSERDAYEICPICLWEDDAIQENDPDMEGGANKVSLRQGQRNFARFGACDKESIVLVRNPGLDDERDPDWRPF